MELKEHKLLLALIIALTLGIALIALVRTRSE